MSPKPTVLHEDTDLVVIDKPAGLMVHGDGRFAGETLVDWVLATYPEMEGIGEAMDIATEDPLSDEEGPKEKMAAGTIERPGIVHRLDKDTSGVLLLARTAIAHGRLKKQFMSRAMRKTYRAFVYGNVTQERGTIDRPIGKSRSDFRQWSAGRGPRGTVREARTDFRTIMHAAEASYVEVFPQTGRTHQIRVHFKAIHRPVICDSLYAPGRPALLGFSRLALHARSIAFTHPATGEDVLFEAPLPADFVEAERQLAALLPKQ